MKRLMLALLAGSIIAAPSMARPNGPRLEPILQTPLVFGGITISSEGRRFSPFRRQKPDHGIQVAEWIDGQPHAYPDEAWNAWSPGKDPRTAFVGVNAIRVGPDGALWIVDPGTTGIGKVPEIGGPKLVRVDLATNTISRIYPLGPATWPSSFVDDVRFHGRTAYLTDAGAPGLILLDLDSGKMRRVLEGDRSAAQQRPLTAEGRPVVSADKLPVQLHADQIEISPDGRWVYYQPITGPLYRIERRWLDDAGLSDKERARHAAVFAQTRNTGGTAMDAHGNIYASDLDALAIYKITPSGRMSTVIKDARLLWVDAMWIDDRGNLWLPASQQNRSANLNGGVGAISGPTWIYRVKLRGS